MRPASTSGQRLEGPTQLAFARRWDRQRKRAFIRLAYADVERQRRGRQLSSTSRQYVRGREFLHLHVSANRHDGYDDIVRASGAARHFHDRNP